MRNRLAILRLLYLYILLAVLAVERPLRASGDTPNSPLRIMRCSGVAFAFARRASFGRRLGSGKVLGAWPRRLGVAASDSGGVMMLSHDFRHSNPEIQRLLDRYKRVSEEVPVTPPDSVGDETLGRGRSIHSASRAVFSNTLVDLSRIEVVGFDYDYTLATCEVMACSLGDHETNHFDRSGDSQQ